MLHGWELLVVLFIILLLFGARKIPDLGKGLGKGIRSFKEGLGGRSDEEGEQKEVEGQQESEKKLIS